MLKISLFSFILISCFTLISQGAISYSLKVTERNLPKSNLEIVLIETSTYERKTFLTDANGALDFTLTEGAVWMMNVGEMKGYALLKLSPYGSKGSSVIPYNVERWNRINQSPVNRTKVNLIEVPQKGVTSNTTPQKGHSVIEIDLKNGKGQVWRSVQVKMISFELNKSFVAYTDSRGIARFHIPNNQRYQIDLDGEVDYDYCDLGGRSVIKTLNFLYEKINFIEKVNTEGDTEQTFMEDPIPMSNRVMVTLNVQGGPNEGMNEDVYLDMTYSNNRYHGVTDENGDVIFLLPKKKTYLVSFHFQDNAGVVDLSRMRGIGQMSMGYIYSPDPRLEYPEDYLPTASEVKAFDINSFNKMKYPDTDDDNLINTYAKWGGNKINSESKEAIMEIGFSVKEPDQKATNSKPLNISFVLDKSGSMAGENIEILKKSMLKFISKLRPIDNVSIVFFDSESVVAYSQSLAKKNELEDIIYAFQARGGTNIYEGLKMGYEQISKTYDSKSTNRLILLTDGYGSKPIDFILEQSKSYFMKGISVSTIGVGHSYNNSLLSLLSKYSGGFEHHVLEADGIDAALDAEFESLFYPLASDLKVTVIYNDKIVYKTLYGIPEKKVSDNSVSFELKNVYCTLNKMALMKFKLNNPKPDIEKDIITIKVNYYDEVKQQDVETVKEMNLEWTDETDLELIYNDNLKQIYSVAYVNQCLKVIADLCDAKNYDAAKININETLTLINKITNDKFSEELLPLIKMLKGYLVVLDTAIKNKK